jgi:hypothetical protein
MLLWKGMVFVPLYETEIMKDDSKKNEQKLSTDQSDDQAKGRENIDPLDKKETMSEKAEREGWTDVAESHLGIDE